MDYYKLKVLNNKRMIFIVLGCLLAVSLLIYYFYFYENKEISYEPDNIIINNNIDNTSDKLIYVDIKGQVNNPGVYEFHESDDARVNDLIEKAGGLTSNADTSLINLSKKLIDEMTIIIYSPSEINEYASIKNELERKLEICEITLKNKACIKENDNKNQDNLVNINIATKEELMSLNGIGESKAKAIIEYRKSNTFEKIEDIMNVDGIGENLFESIKSNITV